MQAYNVFISGRVQGVGYRWFTEREARRRPITGYVRNLSDGRVEVFAQGAPQELDRFCDCLREGPVSARVDDVEILTVPLDRSLTSFSVVV